jgi:hypothetical protein
VKAWEVTAITNFTLAGEAFFAAGFLLGKMPFVVSARSFWTLAVLFFAVGFLVAGIDHGFFEPKGNTRARLIVQKVSWFCGGITTFLITISTAYQFASGSLRLALLVVGLALLIIFLIVAIRIHHFLVVLINYVPILLLLLILNIMGLASGSGSWYMILGITISILAAVFEGFGVDIFVPVDRHGLYHLVMMVAVAFLFLATFDLKV